MVVLARVCDDKTQIRVIYDACHKECFVAIGGRGTWLNGIILQPLQPANLTDDSVGVGFSNRVTTAGVNTVVDNILNADGVFYRNASGALSLVYVAYVWLLGYMEKPTNAWDCLAGQLLEAEAGGGSKAQLQRQ